MKQYPAVYIAIYRNKFWSEMEIYIPKMMYQPYLNCKQTRLCLYICLHIICFEGNLLVLVAVSRYMKPWTTTNILISSMSASDLLSTVTCVPIQVSVSPMFIYIYIYICISIYRIVQEIQRRGYHG